MMTRPPYLEEEKELIKKAIKEKKGLTYIVNELNKKFWGGKNFRTERGVETFIVRQGWSLRQYGSRALGLLTENMKKTIELYEKGLKIEEIANILQIPVGTVKSRISSYLNSYKNTPRFIRNSSLVPEVKPKKDLSIILVEKLKILEKELAETKRKLNYKLAISDIIKETLFNAVKEVVPLHIKKTPIVYTKQTRKPEIAMLDMSDWHLGNKTETIDVLNMGHYNWDIAMKRLNTLSEGVLEILDIIQKSIPIQRFYINMLGDIVDGEAIFRGQGRSIDKTSASQAIEGAEAIIQKVILPLKTYFKFPISIRCVNGNHGRGLGRKGEAHWNTNWDYVLYHHMAARLQHISDIEFIISNSLVMLYDVKETPDWRHLIMHGDSIRSWSGIPFYGIDRATMKLQNLFGMPVHFIHIGHFHTMSSSDQPRGKKLISGSAVGVTEYAVGSLHTGSEAKQTLYCFNNRYGKTGEWDIQLAPLKPLVANTQGIYTPISKPFEDLTNQKIQNQNLKNRRT